MPEYIFSYGTLQKENVQLELFRRVLTGTRDILKGYAIVAIEITDASFLARGEDAQQRTLVCSKNESDSVEGIAFEMSAEELHEADKYEPANYKRIKVVLASGKEA